MLFELFTEPMIARLADTLTRLIHNNGRLPISVNSCHSYYQLKRGSIWTSFRFQHLHGSISIMQCYLHILIYLNILDSLMDMNTKALFVAIMIVATVGIMAAATGVVAITPVLAQVNQTTGGNMTGGGNMTAAMDDNMTSTGG
jgi:hypothetical protein